ncbi:hypothetical protein ACSV5M_03365 [Cellvibrio sp. ARAG 10.3]|uniref:hypothetical protein n=1 Tax=Cellvibrio sp. ARAG 10.3 TaxID=3451358 RepID=UPI003F4892F0
MRLCTFRLISSGIILLLIACSPAPDNRAGSGRMSFATTALDAMENELLAKGWRHGTLEIRVRVEQGGKLHEESSAGGGTKTAVKWAFNLKARRLFDVLVAPDLAQLPSPAETEDALRSGINRSPVYLKPLVTQQPPQGRVEYTKRLTIDSPGSDTYRHLKENTRAEGAIQQLRIVNLRPSFYGRGYEFELLLAYDMMMHSTKLAQPVKGSATYVEEELPVDESLIMHLYPEPDLDVLYAHPFGAAASDNGRQLALDRFRALQDVATGVTLIGDLRPGVQWSGERDELTLSYNLSGNSQPPLFGDITGLATRINPNRVKVEVIIKAR